MNMIHFVLMSCDGVGRLVVQTFEDDADGRRALREEVQSLWHRGFKEGADTTPHSCEWTLLEAQKRNVGSGSGLPV